MLLSDRTRLLLVTLTTRRPSGRTELRRNSVGEPFTDTMPASPRIHSKRRITVGTAAGVGGADGGFPVRIIGAVATGAPLGTPLPGMAGGKETDAAVEIGALDPAGTPPICFS